MTVVLAALCTTLAAGLLLGAGGVRLGPARARRVCSSPLRLSSAASYARVSRRPDSPVSDVALAAELIVVALRAGVPLASAIDAAGRAVGGQVGLDLQDVCRRHQVGADMQTATDQLRARPATARLGRALARAGDSGASPVAVLTAAADAERSAQRSARVTRARTAGSLAALPVGLLFLPAFVLVAVVPVVVGSLGALFGSP